ncbi:MAG: WD40 repeat domain-containing protein [Anaerolineae bacterium]|nr:WD40 repeat domain-containing protein [Anaerolineae bacterium]
MDNVMISYSRADKPFVKDVCAQLESHQLSLWVDWHDIPPGQNWWELIAGGIAGSENVALFITQTWLKSRVCHKEAAEAIRLGKRIIPVMREKIEIEPISAGWPPEWKATALSNWAYISTINWLRMYGDAPQAADVDQLVVAIKTDPEFVQTHTDLINDALKWQQNGERADFLARGRALTRAEDWLKQSQTKAEPKPTPLLTQFVLASRQASSARQRLTLGAVTTALFITVGLLLLALFLRQLAERRGAEARSVSWASGAQLNLNEHNASLALALALEANQLDDPPHFAQTTLFDAAYAPGLRQVIHAHDAEPNLARRWVWRLASSRDGHYLLSASYDGSYALWDAETMRELGRWQHPAVGDNPSPQILDVAFSPDDQSFISAGYGGQLIWQATTTGTILAQMQAGQPLLSAAFSPDGMAVYSGDAVGEITRWNPASQTVVWTATLPAAPGQAAINRIAVSPDARWLLVGNDAGTVRLIDAENGFTVRDLAGHSDRVRGIAFSPDGTHALTGSRDGFMKLWDVKSGELLHTFAHRAAIYDVRFSADGRTAFSCSFDTSIVRWDLDTYQPILTFDDVATAVASLSLSPDETRLYTGDSDGLIEVWDLRRGDEMTRVQAAETRLNTVGLSSDGRYALSGAADGEIRLWDAATWDELRSFNAGNASITSVAFSPDARHAAAGDTAGAVHIWEVNTGRLVTRFGGHSAGVSSVVFTLDGERILSAGGRSDLLLWRVADGALVHSFTGHTQPEQFQPAIVVAMSPDGHSFASGDAEGELFVWNLDDFRRLNILEKQDDSIRSLAYSADGRFLVAGADTDMTTAAVLLWDLDHLESTTTFSQRYEGHSSTAWSVAISPDSRLIVSASDDTTILVWDRVSGEILRRVTGYRAPVRSVAYRPDGSGFISGGDDGTLRGWRLDDVDALAQWLADNRYVPALTCAERAQYQVEPLCETG